MQLVELVLSGMQGITAAHRLQFAAKKVSPVGDAISERLLRRVLLDLLYPKETGSALLDAVANDQARAALTVEANGARYRMMLEVKTNKRTVVRIDAGQPQPVAAGPADVARFVVETLGLPSEGAAAGVLFVTDSALPSRVAPSSHLAVSSAAPMPTAIASPAPTQKRSSGRFDLKTGKALPPGFEETGVDDGALDVDKMRSRIGEIDQILQKQVAVKQAEFEVDGMQRQIFDIEARLKPFGKLRQNIDDAKEVTRRYAHLDGMPRDLPERCAKFQKNRDEFEADIERLVDERRMLVARAGENGLEREPLKDVVVREPLLVNGALAGIAAVVIASIGYFFFDAMRWLALIDVPAFGVAVVGAIRTISLIEDQELLRRRAERVIEDERKVRARLKQEEDEIQALLKRHNQALDRISDLEEEFEARAMLERAVDAAQAEFDQANAHGEFEQGEREKTMLQGRIREFEERIFEGGVGVMPGSDLGAEREALVEHLALHDQASQYDRASTTAPISQSSMVGSQGEDVARGLLSLAREIFKCSIDEVAMRVTERASQLGAVMTEGRYPRLQFVGDVDCHALDAASGTLVAFPRLFGADRDALFVALHVAVVEAFVRERPLPVVYDRLFEAMDGQAASITRMAEFLGSLGQIIVVTRKPWFQSK